MIYVAAFAALWLGWLALTNSTGYREMIAGLVGAGLSILGVAVYARQLRVGFRFRARDLAQIWRIPWYVVQGTWEIYQALFRQLFGAGADNSVGAVKFDVGEKDSPYSAGRRALAVTYTTITPNSIVLGIVMEEGLLLYSQIKVGPVRPMTRRLGAQP